MNATYEIKSPFTCTIERDDLGLVVTGWNIRPIPGAAEYIEDNLEKEFPDFPPIPGEYVVRGVFCESSEARTNDYPGSYELGVIEAEYTYLINQMETLNK